MKISTTGQYAVRLMVEVAKSPEPLSISQIAKNQDISNKYLEQIVSSLVKEELLESLRGQKGGYKLTRPANKISIKQILDTTGDACTLAPCVNGECARKNKCNASSVWQALGSLINNYLDGITLKDLIDKTVYYHKNIINKL